MSKEPQEGITESQAMEIWEAVEFLSEILSSRGVLNIIEEDQEDDNP